MQNIQTNDTQLNTFLRTDSVGTIFNFNYIKSTIK